MRAVLIAAIAAALVGCGKKEEPPPKPEPVAGSAVTACFDVVILRVDREADKTVSLLEQTSPEEGHAPQRYFRSGDFGQAGEKFRYCE